MTRYLRAYVDQQASEGDALQPVRFIASTEGLKMDGKNLKADKWILERFNAHPIVLYVHDYLGRNLPLGTAKPFFEQTNLMMDVSFDPDDEFAMKVRSKALKGMMGGSVGWDETKEGNELLEFSVVPVPMDPKALPQRQVRGFQDWEEWATELVNSDDTHAANGKRRAIAPHSTAKAEEGAAWDGPGEVAKAEGKTQLRRMHAWVDDEGDAETKQAYKLPHHMAESGQVVWRGVAAAMARLLQAGTQIPDDDRRGVYNHLARHYGQFDKEPPEFRSLEELEGLGEEEIRGLFLEGEEFTTETRAGAVLSGRNKSDLEQAVTLIQGVLERAAKEDTAASSGKDAEREWRTDLLGAEGYDEEEIEYFETLRMRLSLGGLS